jgi:putative phosphoesterase
VKLGFISDVHGDPEALERACNHLRALGADEILCAGDIVGYGPNPDAAVAFLAERGIRCVRGNHDRWALQRPAGAPDPFGGGAPGAATLGFLAQLPNHLVVTKGDRRAVIVHGSIRSDMEFVLRPTHPPEVLRRDLVSVDAHLLVVGHTHEPMWFRCAQGLVLNPGSLIALPVVNSSRSFALVDLETLACAFHDASTGQPIEVPPWPEEIADPDPSPEAGPAGTQPVDG